MHYERLLAFLDGLSFDRWVNWNQKAQHAARKKKHAVCVNLFPIVFAKVQYLALTALDTLLNAGTFSGCVQQQVKVYLRDTVDVSHFH